MFGNKKIMELEEEIRSIRNYATGLERKLEDKSIESAYSKREFDIKIAEAKQTLTSEYMGRLNQLKQEASNFEKEKALAVESAKNEIRLELTKACIESDLKRVEAETALRTYEKVDTKTEKENLQKNFQTLLGGVVDSMKPPVSNTTVNNVIPEKK